MRPFQGPCTEGTRGCTGTLEKRRAITEPQGIPGSQGNSQSQQIQNTPLGGGQDFVELTFPLGSCTIPILSLPSMSWVDQALWDILSPPSGQRVSTPAAGRQHTHVSPEHRGTPPWCRGWWSCAPGGSLSSSSSGIPPLTWCLQSGFLSRIKGIWLESKKWNLQQFTRSIQ